MKKTLCILFVCYFTLSFFSCGKRIDVFSPTATADQTSKSTEHTIQTSTPSISPNEPPTTNAESVETPASSEPTLTLSTEPTTKVEPTPTPSTDPTPSVIEPTPTPQTDVKFASLTHEEAVELFGDAVTTDFSDEYEFFMGYWINKSVRTLLKRDRATDVVSPVCIDSACTHDQRSNCPFADISLSSCLSFGEYLYFSESINEYIDGVSKTLYVLQRYSMKTGEKLTIYKGSQVAHLLKLYSTYPYPVYTKKILSSTFANVKVFYKISPSGDSEELFRVTGEKMIIDGMWNGRYLVRCNGDAQSKTGDEAELYDTVTGKGEALNKGDLYYSFCPIMAERYLLMYDSHPWNKQGDYLLYDLKTEEITRLFERKDVEFVTDRIVGVLEEGNILRIYNVITQDESVFDLPDSIKRSYVYTPRILDGILMLGTQIIYVNGQRTRAYDCQIDLLSGRVRYRTEEIEVYSPDLPPYIVLEKEEVS